MPKSEFKRVRLESGAKVTVLHVGDGMEQVDEPAVDRNGRPLDATYPEQTSADGSTEPASPYGEWLVDDLKVEIDRRNDTRGEDDDEIVPAGAKKADLVAALEADDASRA